MARGIDRQPIFLDDRDRDDFVRRVAALASAGKVLIYAWALVPNHAHLLVRTASLPLARVMRSLLTGYAGAFNRRHGRHGHLFQNRYKSLLCQDEPYLLELVRYIHLNPLHAGLVRDLAALDHYRYSGHAIVLGDLAGPWLQTGEILARFDSEPAEARARYRAFVADGARAGGHRIDLVGGGLVRTAEGWTLVSELPHGREAYRSHERILGQPEFLDQVLRQLDEAETAARKHRPVTLEILLTAVCRDQQITHEAIRGGGRLAAVSRAREGLAYLWVECLGRSGRQLAQSIGVRPESVYKAARRGALTSTRWRQLLSHIPQGH
jgi:REP element-mobilizing transposase RayT